MRSKVWLPGGGYIVINQTEALVAIDVNTGRFVGKDDLEDTLLKANLDAVREIVRQIRLRDLGGIIVVDFIDMEERKSRRDVLHALEQELRKDRSPTKLLSVNEFGLVILTRKRVKQSLDKLLLSPCPYCSGSGQVKSVSTVCSEIYDEVRKLAPDMPGQKLVLRVNPEIARALEGDEANVLRSLSALTAGRAHGAGRPAPAPGAVRRGGGLSEAERDPELEAFVEAIEAAFRARRGKDHVLAPRDFALARGFFEAGVPLATVLVAIDAAFERDPQTASLAVVPAQRRGAGRRPAPPATPPARASARTCPRWASGSTPCASGSWSCPGARRRCRSPSSASSRTSSPCPRVPTGTTCVSGCAASTTSWRPLPSTRSRPSRRRRSRTRPRAPRSGSAARSTSTRSRRRRLGSTVSAPARRCGYRGRRRLASHASPCRVKSTRPATKRTPSARRRLRCTSPEARPSSEMRPRAPTTRCHGTLASRRPIPPSAQPTARAPRVTPTSAATWP